jgi:hypothetical protein
LGPEISKNPGLAPPLGDDEVWPTILVDVGNGRRSTFALHPDSRCLRAQGIEGSVASSAQEQSQSCIITGQAMIWPEVVLGQE